MDSLEALFSLRGRRALVTGASSGLGVECAAALAIAGADVALVARRAGRVEKLAAELSRTYRIKAAGVGADVSIDADLDRALAQASGALGGVIDILVNNAGVSPTGRAENFKREDWDHALAVNLTAPMMLSQRVARALIAAKKAGQDHQYRVDLRKRREFGLSPVGLRCDQGRARKSHPATRRRMGAARDSGKRDRARMDSHRSDRARNRKGRQQAADGGVHAARPPRPPRGIARRRGLPCRSRFQLRYRRHARG